MKLVVCTQYWENYGDEQNPRWKPKGGEEIIVARLSTPEVISMGQKGLQEVVNRATKIIDYNHPMAQKYVTDWHLLEDTQHTCWEEDQLKFEGKIEFHTLDISEDVRNAT